MLFHKTKNNQDTFFGLLFFTLGILTRIPFVEKIQSHWDGPQYSIALVRYSLEQETPAPPGYPLYIGIGYLLQVIFKNPFYSLIITSVLFSGLGALSFYLIGTKMFNRAVGIISALLYLSGSTFYYFGLTVYPYGLAPFFALLSAFSVYRIIIHKKQIGVILGIMFSLVIGIRPQELFATLPLFFLGLYYLSNRQRLLAIAGFTFSFLIWFIPLMIITGGVKQYIMISIVFARAGALPPISFENIKILLPRITRGMALSFGVSVIFLIYYLKLARDIMAKKQKIHDVLANKYLQLFAIWIIPSLLFNLLVRSEHAGYQMVYLSPFPILIAYAIWKLCQKKNRALTAIVFLIVIFNLWWFFKDRDPFYKLPYSPTSFHYSEIRKNDIKLGSKIDFIKKHFDPNSTLLITSPNPWRPLMYHLPSYSIYDIDGLTTNDKRFSSIVRKSRYWNFSKENDSDGRFVVPAEIRTITLTDDRASFWVKGVDKTSYRLLGNSDITAINTKEGEIFIYAFNLFEKI